MKKQKDQQPQVEERTQVSLEKIFPNDEHYYYDHKLTMFDLGNESEAL